MHSDNDNHRWMTMAGVTALPLSAPMNNIATVMQPWPVPNKVAEPYIAMRSAELGLRNLKSGSSRKQRRIKVRNEVAEPYIPTN